MPKVYLLKISRILAYVALAGSVTAIARLVPLGALLFFVLSFIVGFILDNKSIKNYFFTPLFIFLLIIPGIVLSLIGINDENLFNRLQGILLIIISAKLIAPKKARDLLQIFLLNFLVVVAAAVTRWGLEFGLLVLLETFISVTGLLLVYGSYEQQDMPVDQVWHLVRWSSLITLCLIPATIFFFLVMPRPSRSFLAWGGGVVSKSGFSDRVTPGAVEQIKVDPSPAFRVKWLRGERPLKPLWRGIVYDSYHEGVWEKRYKRRVDLPIIWPETVEYEILLEPTVSKYLLSFGLPVKIALKGQRTTLVSGYTIHVPGGIFRRTLYQVMSHPLQDFPADVSADYYLKIPEEIERALISLAKPLAKEGFLGTARTVESYLKTSFAYDLSPGEAQGDPVNYFLFTSKKGHCEYFASAMVLLLRTLGIPSRIVGGYLGGDWNEIGQYFLVRQSDAHTWVEVWIEDRGWVTFDPTPEVFVPKKSFLGIKIFGFIDFLRLKWYYWVLNYDSERQINLARRTASLLKSFRSGDHRFALSFKVSDLKKLIPFFIICVFIFLVKSAWSYFRKRPKTWGERFVRVFKRYGYFKPEGETLQEFAVTLASDNALLGQNALVFVEQYYLLEYGQEGQEETLAQLLKETETVLKEGKSGVSKPQGSL